MVVPPLLFGDGVDYSKVTSIKREPTYQDPVLLAKAFAMPVAAAYQRRGLAYQGNPSFCGPTTAVDVERSLGAAVHQARILDGTAVHPILGVVWVGSRSMRRPTSCAGRRGGG